VTSRVGRAGRPARASFPVPAIAVTIALLVAACAKTTVRLEPVPRTFTPQDYTRIYKRWTREADEFAWSRLTDVLTVTATFESWEFRTAYLVRYADDYGIDTTERDRLLAASLEDAKQFHRFFVTLVGPNFRESDLTGRRAAFRALMVDDNDRSTAPASLERVHRPTPAERVYFPTVSPLRMTFRIAFPVVRDDGIETIPSDARRVRLRFTGAGGRVDLEWNVDRSAPKK
jgi:hypothetical protein